MKQRQLIYENDAQLQDWLKGLAQGESRLFHIFSTDNDRVRLLHLRDVIAAECPTAKIVGATTNGNIAFGRLEQEAVLITCSIFEDPSTRIETLHFPLCEESELETARELVRAVNQRPWVTGVELLLMIRGMSMTGFCQQLADLRPDVCCFGGGCFANDIYDNEAIALEKESGCAEHLVAVLYGGTGLQIRTDRVTGWKPLGQELLVTRADHHGRVYELDGKPAYEIYYHYLHIRNDEHFFENTLEFPFLYNNNGVMLLRAPIACYPDGSLQMTSDMEEGRTARIGFGDPRTILENVDEVGIQVEDFHPQAVLIFSCAARKAFWGETECSRETLPFEDLAPTYGFYTSGEFIREKRELQQNNVSLVIASFREGTPVKTADAPGALTDSCAGAAGSHRFHISGLLADGQVSINARLASFVEAATSELAEANRKLEEANRKLEQANLLLAQQSITDGLTGLLNRKEIQRRIEAKTAELAEADEPGTACLVMMDLDFFKKVNDVWGHEEGDHVLVALSGMLKTFVAAANPKASVGRWGGEEFMILLPDSSIEAAAKLAEQLREQFHLLRYPLADPQTMSVGVTSIRPGETADWAASRVDAALYEAKRRGRNQVHVEEGSAV